MLPNQQTNTICRWCDMIHGPLCPSVSALDFHRDGTVKRVEFTQPRTVSSMDLTKTLIGPSNLVPDGRGGLRLACGPSDSGNTAPMMDQHTNLIDLITDVIAGDCSCDRICASLSDCTCRTTAERIVALVRGASDTADQNTNLAAFMRKICPRHLEERAQSCEQQAIEPAVAQEVSLPGVVEWRASEDDTELTLLHDGRRVGAITVWADNQTGNVAWWCGIIAGVAGDQELSGFHDTKDDAKAALIRALAAQLN